MVHVDGEVADRRKLEVVTGTSPCDSLSGALGRVEHILKRLVAISRPLQIEDCSLLANHRQKRSSLGKWAERHVRDVPAHVIAAEGLSGLFLAQHRSGGVGADKKR